MTVYLQFARSLEKRDERLVFTGETGGLNCDGNFSGVSKAWVGWIGIRPILPL
jgi:hypothetical protein